MNHAKLTCPTGPAHKARMERSSKGLAGAMPKLVLVAGLLVLPGCITINAPEDAIVIELNINIRQEVIYRLAADAEDAIEENADIF